jgi:hypothetical protein
VHAPPNAAVTVAAADIVTAQVPVPLQPPPLQPSNVAPAPGVAISCTLVPAGYVAVQSAPQLMPGGVDVTSPPPVPVVTTVKAYAAVHALAAQSSPGGHASAAPHSRHGSVS